MGHGTAHIRIAARAANGAYAVDAADISDLGSCDRKFTETLQWTIEADGQAGQSDTPSVVRPRFQTGVRYRPKEIFSIDLIYGHNITGENANWITLGTAIRWPVPEGRPPRERTGHL